MRALALAAALAAYAPAVSLELSTREPSAAPALTATLSQASGEDPTRSIASRFPPAFTYNPAFAGVARCPAAAAAAWDCPADSRIGEISVVSPFGRAAGTVHVTEDLRIISRLDAYGGLIASRISGRIAAEADGSAAFVLDDLPAIPVTSGRIVLDGGPRSLFVNPRRCGSYEIGTRLVSHAGEAVEAALPVAIEGCPPPLRVHRVRVSGARVLSWTQSEAAAVEVRVLRRVRAGWREVARRRFAGSAGANRRPVGRLRPGRYRLLVRALADDGRASPARGARLRVTAARRAGPPPRS